MRVRHGIPSNSPRPTARPRARSRSPRPSSPASSCPTATSAQAAGCIASGTDAVDQRRARRRRRAGRCCAPVRSSTSATRSSSPPPTSRSHPGPADRQHPREPRDHQQRHLHSDPGHRPERRHGREHPGQRLAPGARCAHRRRRADGDGRLRQQPDRAEHLRPRHPQLVDAALHRGRGHEQHAAVPGRPRSSTTRSARRAPRRRRRPASGPTASRWPAARRRSRATRSPTRPTARIVVFGAPGSTIQNNTDHREEPAAPRRHQHGRLRADERQLHRHHRHGTTRSTRCPRSSRWASRRANRPGTAPPARNYGATVTGNTLTGQYMGYGYPVNGVTNWTVTGNIDNSRHVGTQTGGGCFGTPPASQPAGFQYEVATSSNLQSQYTSAVLTNALGTVNSPPITAADRPDADREPVRHRVRQPDRRHDQRRARGDRHEHRQSGRDRVVDHGQQRLRADQHLRHIDRGRRVMHGQRHVHTDDAAAADQRHGHRHQQRHEQPDDDHAVRHRHHLDDEPRARRDDDGQQQRSPGSRRRTRTTATPAPTGRA